MKKYLMFCFALLITIFFGNSCVFNKGKDDSKENQESSAIRGGVY
jgi:hypothetical protein